MHSGHVVFLAAVVTIVLAAAFMYVIIMGPSRYHRDGCVGQIYNRLQSLPKVCGSYLCCLFCACCSYSRGERRLGRCVQHTFSERNVFMVVFYIVLVIPAEVMYLFYMLPTLQTSRIAKGISWYLVLQSEVFYLLSVFSNPGIVTPIAAWEDHKAAFGKHADGKKSPVAAGATTGSRVHKPHTKRSFPLSPAAEFKQNTKYRVDGMVYAIAGSGDVRLPPDYHEGLCRACPGVEKGPGGPAPLGQVCYTCRVPRPCRSKHCKLCGVCVRRYDHHCPWINNDVAEGTHRWFLLFLFTHAVSCTWATVDLIAVLYQFLQRHRLLGWRMYIRGGYSVPIGVLDYVAILVTHQTMASCLIFFAVFIGIVLWVFWGYQLSFCLFNLTAYELSKMEDAATFVSDRKTLEEVYHEAMQVKQRLEEIAEKKPLALRKILPPPPLEPLPTGPASGVGHSIAAKLFLREQQQVLARNEKTEEIYRKAVRNAVLNSLQGLYDRGPLRNMLEVLFPY